MKETEINHVSVSHDRQLIAVADKQGSARILRYPAFTPDQAALKLEPYHSTGGVSSIGFTA